MSQSKQNKKIVIENILLSGYLREHEENVDIEIPKLVTHILIAYCKQYMVQTLGGIPTDESMTDKLDKWMDNDNKLNTIEFHKNLSKQMNDEEIIDIEYGSDHTLYLTANGNVYAFGSNDCGQSALGEQIKYVQIPTLIPFKSKIISIGCGELHSLFIDENGKLFVSGYNYCGQLGLESITKQIEEKDPENGSLTISNIRDISHTSNMSIITDSTDIDDDDDFFDNDDDDDDDDFFDNDDDDDDDDNYEHHNVYKPMLHSYFDDLNIVLIAAKCGDYHSLLITKDGQCYTFGHNGFGNLGNGQHTEWGQGVNIPYKLDINKKIINAECGKNHNILITENNEIVVFGDNKFNQCSITNRNQIEIPYILSKQTEFGVSENCFIEKIICIKNKSISIIDVYKRHFI